MTPTEIFVYGTLMPGQLRWPALQPVASRVRPDTVPGRLYRTPYGWPAADFRPSSANVPGAVVTIHRDKTAVALSTLDAIEGVDSGLFTRRGVLTCQGSLCWSYQWAGNCGHFELIAKWPAM